MTTRLPVLSKTAFKVFIDYNASVRYFRRGQGNEVFLAQIDAGLSLAKLRLRDPEFTRVIVGVVWLSVQTWTVFGF